MNNRYIFFSFIAIVTTVAILFSACRKINEATELGGDLIPPVDNINTFDTSITVQAFNDTFGILTDSTRLPGSEEQFLGRINNDPFFGKTDARMFFELKPPVFPFTFLNKKDSLYIDSVVLVMQYAETYGDTNTLQTVNVYEMDQTNKFTSDSIYLIRKNDFTYSNLLGSRTFAPNVLNDSVKARGDTSVNEMRIKLSNSFGSRLLNYDTLGNGAYKNDSLFRTNFKGFALQSMNSGNAVMGFNLANSRLAIYYRYNNGGVAKFDTTQAYFIFKTGVGTANSASANYIIRDYTGTPVQASLGGSTPDPVVYVQTTPGTFATIKIPDLLNVSNRTIHRAELIVEQMYDISDTLFRAPNYLYLDASDPTIARSYKFRTIPYDLLVTTSGPTNFSQFGVTPKITVDGSGNRIRVWKFNISRYVQHVLTRTQPLYDLRLSAPFYIFESAGTPPDQDPVIPVFVNPSIVKGRVRIHGNTGSGDTNPQRLRLRLVYSKL